MTKKFHYLLTIFFLLSFWWAFSIFINKNAFPTPLVAFESFFNSLGKDLPLHIRVSLYRVLVSLLIAAAIGVPLGLFLGKNKKIDKFIAPAIYLTYPIPKVVFMPILMILLGIGDTSKISLITLIVFYQILVTTRDAARSLEKEYILSVKSLGANSFELYKHVYFPGCLPAILTSLRLGLGTAMAVLFLAETYATQEGIGYFILDSFSRMNYEEMFAGIIAMAIMGFFLYIILERIENISCAWIKS